MARKYTITTPAESVRLDAAGRADVAFNVTNVSGIPARGMAKLVPQGTTKQEWLTVSGENDRDFPVGGTNQFTVSINVPAGTPAGKYAFGFNIISGNKSGQDYDEGPTVSFEAAPSAGPKKSYTWLWAAIAAIVVVAGVVTWLLMRNKGIVVPDVSSDHRAAAAAIDGVQAAGLGVALAFDGPTDGVAPGSVVSQQPAAGQKAASANDSVTLHVASDRPVTFTLTADDARKLSDPSRTALNGLFSGLELPDARQMSVVDAMRSIQNAGFKTNVTFTVGESDIGIVTTQVPAPPDHADRGSAINLTVPVTQPVTLHISDADNAHLSAGTAQQLRGLFTPIPVPAETTKFVTSAISDLQSRQFNFEIAYNRTNAVAEGFVTDQNPKANTSVPPGSKVVLTVATPPLKILPPILVSSQFGQAQKAAAVSNYYKALVAAPPPQKP